MWEPAGIIDTFNRDDDTELRIPWINETPSADYHAGIVGHTMRMAGLPDESVPLTTSRFRHNLTIPDDGWLEIVPATFGSTNYVTQVFRRYQDSGAMSAGVGIDLRGSALSIVSRVGSVDTVHRCGVYAAGDTLRLTQAGDVHTLTRNGAAAGNPWNDSGHTAHRGAGYRSVGLRVDGGLGIHPRLSAALSSIAAQ